MQNLLYDMAGVKESSHENICSPHRTLLQKGQLPRYPFLKNVSDRIHEQQMLLQVLIPPIDEPQIITKSTLVEETDFEGEEI